MNLVWAIVDFEMVANTNALARKESSELPFSPSSPRRTLSLDPVLPQITILNQVTVILFGYLATFFFKKKKVI